MLRSPQSGARGCIGSSSGRKGRRVSETQGRARWRSQADVIARSAGEQQALQTGFVAGAVRA